MKTDPIESGICLNCGSTEYIEDYPVKGKRICVKCGHENVKMELKVVETGKEMHACNLTKTFAVLEESQINSFDPSGRRSNKRGDSGNP